MSAIFSTGNSLTRLLTIGAAALLLALTLGGAVIERMEQRAAGDRLFLGDINSDGGAAKLRVANNG